MRLQAQKTRKKGYSIALICAVSFFITVAILYLLYYIKGYAPFGDASKIYEDSWIQYLDLFSYLKDVSVGNNSLIYTLSKELGGTGVAVFSYYLSSPFNILILFFEKTNLVTFLYLVTALKLGTAALTMAFFLQGRFQQKLSPCFVVLLSISYALMQYSIAQSCNVMWLDGVYMLPLMLLGVYKVINGQRPWLLVVSTALAVVFNWYSAGINVLFTIIWFCLEWALAISKRHLKLRDAVKYSAKTVGKYAATMIGGALLSAFLLVPTLLILSSNGRGTIDWSIFESAFSGNIFNIIQNFTLGSTSSEGSVSLFCGSLALLGCLGFFTSKNKKGTRKLILGGALVLSVFLFYWQPLFSAFSLFKYADSYWYRYSYVAIFLLVFISADYYSDIKQEENVSSSLLRNAFLFSAILLVFSFLNPVWPIEDVYYTCIFTIGIALLIALYTGKLSMRARVKPVAALLLTCVLVAELAINAGILMDTYNYRDASTYGKYSLEQQEQIDQIQEMDSGLYRITQTSNYGTWTNDVLTANYNEALAYHYWSLAGYTSDPNDMERDFLNALGYRKNGENMCIVDTSILAADSLLGVKYVLSSYDINGLEKIDDLGEINDKKVYYNPYALPLAFVYNETVYSQGNDDELNPFEYQNLIYSKLLGKETALYSKVDYRQSEKDGVITYKLTIPDGNYAVYGNIPWTTYMKAQLDVNDSYEMSYSRWLSPSVFYIPTENGDISATVNMKYETETDQKAQFYALDLDILEEATKKLSSSAVSTLSIQSTSIHIETTASIGENLLLSIPYNNGWTVKLNGEEIEPELFANCLYSIPLQEGENIIQMDYQVPGLEIGLIITGGTVVFLVGFIILGEWMRRRNNMKQKIQGHTYT